MKRQRLTVLAVLLVLAAAVRGEEPGKTDLDQMQGTWVLVSAQRDGKKLPAEEVKKTRITIKGDTFVFPDAAGIGTSQKGTITLDPTKKPKWMDSKATVGPDKGKISLGIYEITDNGYKVCFAPPGKDRPKEFSSKPGSDHNLQIWKRLKE